jgi:hypothetical protein
VPARVRAELAVMVVRRVRAILRFMAGPSVWFV